MPHLKRIWNVPWDIKNMALSNKCMETMAKEAFTRFTVDGIVAEMSIEVEENDQHSQKTPTKTSENECGEVGSSKLKSEASKENDWGKTVEISNEKLLELDDKSHKDCVLKSEFLEEKEMHAPKEKEVKDKELSKQNEESMNVKEVFKECSKSLSEDKVEFIKEDKRDFVKKDMQHDKKDVKFDEKDMQEDKKDVQFDEKDMKEDKKDVQFVEIDMEEKKDAQFDEIDMEEDKKDVPFDEKDPGEDQKDVQFDEIDMDEDKKDVQLDEKGMEENQNDIQEDKKDLKEKKDIQEDRKEMQEDENDKQKDEKDIQDDKRSLQGNEKAIQDKKEMQEDEMEAQVDEKIGVQGIEKNADEQEISERGIKRKVSDDYNPERVLKKRKSGLRKKSAAWKKKSVVKVVSKTEESSIEKVPSESKSKEVSDVPVQKSKALLNNEIMEGSGIKLGSILEVKKRVKNGKNLQSLYRVLYNKWYSCSVEEAQEQVLKFSGFPFNEKSPDFVKRRNILRRLSDGYLSVLCNYLNLIKGPKLYMISAILKFLSKPHKLLHPFKDPVYQPVVKLERLSLDNIYLAKALKNCAASEALTENKLKNSTAAKSTPGKSMPAKVKLSKPPNIKKPAVKGVNLKSRNFKKMLKKQSLEKGKSEIQEKVGTKRRKFAEPVVMLKPLTEPSENQKQIADKNKKLVPPKDRRDTQVSQKERKDNQDGKNNSMKETSIEDTSGGKKEIPVAKSPIRKVGKCRLGKPLRLFPAIHERIKKATFSLLQRLHILLFGASEKAENLKPNILAFGGFPFLEGSEEWKQKHFLLSLLAQNTLKEHLDLLCIEHENDDPSVMINKLMKFLAAPNENVLGNEISEIETEVVSSELINNNASTRIRAKGAMSKRRLRKKEKRAAARRQKMDLINEEVKPMETCITQEKKFLNKEKKISNNQTSNSLSTPYTKAPKLTEIAQIAGRAKPSEVGLIKGVEKVKSGKQPMTDPEKLNALLQTVYKRRALKAAGAVISIPNKGEKTRLGDLPNVKFLVVTANYNDLDILHHLIYMSDANKSKVRKNILDFDGFGFAEDSKKYNARIDFLYSLGYDVSKRIAFLLGLCPFKTNIPQQDLNELIMYFLMSPCKTKEVPITQMPLTLVTKDIAKELGHVVDRVKQNNTASPPRGKGQNKGSSPSKINAANIKNVRIKTPVQIKNQLPISQKTPVPDKISIAASQGFQQKAKKSLTSTAPIKLGPVRKVVLSTQPAISPKPAVTSVNATAGKIVQKQIVLPQISRQPVQLQPTLLQSSPLPGQKSVLKVPSVVEAQEFLVQQQTPDGQQKTYKLIRLPPSHPLASAVVKTPQPPQLLAANNTQGLSAGIAVQGPALPPGYIVLKNSPIVRHNQGFQNIVQTVPLIFNQQCNTNPIILPNTVHTAPATSSKEEYVLPDACESKPSASSHWNDDEVEILHPLEDNPPTDDELFNNIQEIIHSSNFEHMTLRNVIDRVSAQYSDFDLTNRHNFIKECVKKIIIGT